MNRLKPWPYKPAAYFVIFILAVVFIAITYTTGAADTNRENLALRLSITFPELIIWAIATVSAVRFKEYAYSIRDAEDGKGLNLIANSLLMLVLYVIFLSSANTFERLFIHSPGLRTAVSLGNYVPLVVILLSTFWLYKGSVSLGKITPGSQAELKKMAASLVPFFLLLGLFAWQFYMAVPNLGSPNGIPRFTQSAGILLLTYVLPHILLWIGGLLACFNIGKYALRIRGVIYKSLFRDLYQGLILVFICIFIAQFIIISPVNLEKFSFLLAIIYLVLILATRGFLLIFNGARKLTKIETLDLNN
jgi:hypothetical protein